MKPEATLRFARLRIENWRNFRRVRVNLPGRAFFVGPNASGKSNLLDVFRFLHDIVAVGGGFQEAVRRRGGISAMRCLAARKNPDVVIHVNIGSDDAPAAWEYEISFAQDKAKRAIVKRERVTRHGKEILLRPDADDQHDPERLTQTYLEQVNVNREFRTVWEFFGAIRYRHIVPQLIREPDRSAGRKDDPFGGDFLEQVARVPQKTRNAWLRRVRDALRVAVPQLQELELWRDVKGTPHLRGNYEHWRLFGAWQTEESFSDGTLRLLGLLWSSLEGLGPLLLEEPELSLHPEVIRFIPQMFARLQRRTGRQILVSTHASDLLHDRGIGLDEVLLLIPAREGTAVRPVSSFAEIPPLLEGGVSLAEAVLPLTRPQKAEQLALFGDSR